MLMDLIIICFIKFFNFKDLNFNLFLSYLIFYPYNLFKKFIKLSKIINFFIFFAKK